VQTAAVGVVYRRPIGAVVTVQRVRRRLQMSRLDSTRLDFSLGQTLSISSYRSIATPLYGITQCYLPPGKGHIPALTTTEASTQLSDHEGCKGKLTWALQ